MSDMTCKTVKIVAPEAPGGFIVINEADRVEGQVLFDEAPAETSKPRPKKTGEE